MVDLEKVIKGYECCLRIDGGCKECPYWDRTNSNKCEGNLKKDALELLKEYKKHLQNDLENLNKKKLQVENKINCITQTERLCRYSEV